MKESPMGHSMPNKAKIKKYWTNELLDLQKFDSEFELMEADYCFACGFYFGGTERCHIKARCTGGPDTVDNLHLLCHSCHVTSELLDGDKYWDWFKNGPYLVHAMFSINRFNEYREFLNGQLS